MRFLYQIQLSDLALQNTNILSFDQINTVLTKDSQITRLQYKSKASQIFETPYSISHFMVSFRSYRT